MKRFLIVALLVICCLSIVACVEEADSVQNIEGVKVWAYHDSTIILESKEPLMGGEPAVFKKDIKASDITVTGTLVGKTVKSVKYISNSEIEVVLTGKVNKYSADGLATIVVSKRALENNYDSFATVSIKKSEVHMGEVMSFSASGKYIGSIYIDNGSFTDSVSMQTVKLAEGSTGELQSVELKDGKIVVTIVGATSVPKITIDASTNTFNKSATLNVRSGASVEME